MKEFVRHFLRNNCSKQCLPKLYFCKVEVIPESEAAEIAKQITSLTSTSNEPVMYSHISSCYASGAATLPEGICIPPISDGIHLKERICSESEKVLLF